MWLIAIKKKNRLTAPVKMFFPYFTEYCFHCKENNVNPNSFPTLWKPQQRKTIQFLKWLLVYFTDAESLTKCQNAGKHVIYLTQFRGVQAQKGSPNCSNLDTQAHFSFIELLAVLQKNTPSGIRTTILMQYDGNKWHYNIILWAC